MVALVTGFANWIVTRIDPGLAICPSTNITVFADVDEQLVVENAALIAPSAKVIVRLHAGATPPSPASPVIVTAASVTGSAASRPVAPPSVVEVLVP
jgi:hypothetical protein